MDAVDLATQTYRANKAKLEQLIADAEQKEQEAVRTDEEREWHNFRRGLERALRVIEGQG